MYRKVKPKKKQSGLTVHYMLIYDEMLCDDIVALWAMIKFIFLKCDGISGRAAMLF